MASRFILPALALAGSAFSQSNGVCSGGITISSSADAAAIATCKTYNGNVIISPDASGIVQLNGVQAISGDLRCNNATQLTGITSDQLNLISGTFSLSGLTILSTLQMDALSGVNMISWVGLPALQFLNFRQGISKANNIEISNTQLNTLSGIELTAVGKMDINNNPYLTTINVNELKNVTNALSFSANGRDLQIDFPNLQGAANLTFRNVSQINMPSLASVAGDMGFYSDTFQSFAAPNLTSTGGTLAFVDSPNLNNMSFPQLVTIGGGFLVANNTNLKSVSGFPKLATIVGAIQWAGTFDKINLPAIKDVRGGSNVETTSTDPAICNQLNAAHSSGIIKGVNNCVTGKSNPQAVNPSGTSGGSSSTSKGAANPNIIDPSAPMTGVWAIIAALLFL